MSIPTSRTKEKAEIRINEELCTGCGLCVEVCSDFGLVIEDGKAKPGSSAVFGCVACGHCMAVCPEGAIEIHGRTMSPEDLFDLPPEEKVAGYDQLLALFQRRRSIREFDGRPVEREKIDRILEAAVTAPMGLPPSDVNILILDSTEKNRAFVKDFCEFLETIKWFVSDW